MTSQNPKTVVIGLDGSNWPLIDSWLDDGDLPNLAKLQDEAAHGISRSQLPPVTCPNWKCYASGKNPGQLGIYWWEHIDADDRSMHLPDSTDFTSPELWDYLNDAGLSAGVVNLPMTSPPRDIDELMVAGGPRSREKGYTKPDGLEKELEDRFGYRVHPENVLTSNEDANREVEMVHDLLRTRLCTAHALLEECNLDFLHVTLFHLNVLQHYFWDGEPTKRAYQIIDEELEPFVKSDYNIILMSDHGCREIDTVFFVNTFLEEHGYLATESSLTSRLYDIGVTQEQIASLVRKAGLEKYIRPLVPRHIIERFPSDQGVVREEKLNMVDWENTTAIGSGQGLVYVVADDEAEREEIRTSLKNDLHNAEWQDKPIAKEVYRREELYSGDQVDKAPDLIFEQRPGVHTSEVMGRDKVYSEPTDWRAENVPDGMLLFHGEDIDPSDLGRIRITDIAPTILHWMGLAVPTDMDGKPVLDAFAAGSETAEREVETRPPLGEQGGRGELDENVQHRLEDIGYLE